ncbi:MAG TPA: GspMb/PilO family protein [Methylibium sp.]|nr:GspMb/PilO family protein [Methylibium sp.]
MEALRRLRWELERATRAGGLPAALALALLLASAALWWGLAVPAIDATERLEAASAALERSRGAQWSDPRETTPARELAAFEQGFPAATDITAVLARLQAAATRRGLQLDEAEFKLTRQAGEPLSRYAMTLPLRAEYRALRRFARDALHEQPGLALEELGLRRSDPRATRLDAQLRFVLFVRDAP